MTSKSWDNFKSQTFTVRCNEVCQCEKKMESWNYRKKWKVQELINIYENFINKFTENNNNNTALIFITYLHLKYMTIKKQSGEV